jgi:TetR/AcrR family transcriptional repressor of nem operon
MLASKKNNSLPQRAAPLTAAATAILDVAERLAQTRGYNGLSYADIAAQLGVTKASLHYHFPSKAQPGCALIERYRVFFAAALDTIDQQANGPGAHAGGAYVVLRR